MEPADLELVHLTKRYGATTAVDSIDLKVPAGAYCCLLGPSGCGKTSTLRMIAGHESATEGDILIGATNVTDLPPAKRGTAMMFQSYALFPASLLRRQRRLLAQDEGRRQGDAAQEGDGVPRARRHDALRASGCRRNCRAASSSASRSRARSSPIRRSFCSTSRCRRSIHSCAFACAPSLRRFQRQLNIPFIHVTHGQDEALALADLVVVMNKGRIEQTATPRELFEKPATEFIARFLGGHNVIETPTGPVAVRADRITLRRGNGSGANDARFIAAVRAIEYQGAHYQVSLDRPGTGELMAVVSDEQFADEPLNIGDNVSVLWADKDIHALAPAS